MANITEIQTLTVNGSTVSFRKIGNGRRKILFFHGFPGSSAQGEFLRQHADEANFEVITIDRPGYNLSKASGSQFEQTNRLLIGLMDHHGWKTCEVISVSGGTPFLFSFVQKYPDRVSKITVVSGLGPIATKEFQHFLSPKLKLALKILPLVPRQFIGFVRPKPNQEISPSQAKFIRYFLEVSPSDQKTILNAATQEILSASMAEAFVQNGLGPQKDAAAYVTPWKLELASFKGPVEIWHGEEDIVLPVNMSRQMHALLPQAKLHIIPNEGHYSLSMNHIQKILKSKI